MTVDARGLSTLSTAPWGKVERPSVRGLARAGCSRREPFELSTGEKKGARYLSEPPRAWHSSLSKHGTLPPSIGKVVSRQKSSVIEKMWSEDEFARPSVRCRAVSKS